MAISAAQLVVAFKSEGSDKVVSDTKKVSRGVTSMASAIAQTAAGFTLGAVINKIAGGINAVAASGPRFEQAMANWNSIAQVTDAQMQSVADSVIALGKDPRITQAPDVLAQGLYDIQSAGFDAAHGGLDILKTSAYAATAGLTDAATSGRSITAVLNAYGEGADQAAHVSDVLFQTVQDGVLTFEQLANNMGNTLPAANALGVSFEELGAAYAQMTLKGVDASQAETQIASLMKAAANPTQALTDTLNAHNYATAADAIAAEGLAGFIAMITEAAGGNDAALYDMLGTQEAVNAAHILGANNAADYAAEVDKMAHASDGAGATQKALAKQMESASFQIQRARVALATLATVGFGVIAPLVASAANGFARLVGNGILPFVNVIAKATQGNWQFKKVLDQVPEPLRRTAHGLGVVVEGFSDLVSILRGRINISRLPDELRQIQGGLNAIGEELQQGARWAANIAIDTAVALGGFLWDHRDDIWSGIKGLTNWGVGEFSDAISVGLEVASFFWDKAPDLWGWVEKQFGGGGDVPAGVGGADAWLAYGQQAKHKPVDIGDIAVDMRDFVWGKVKDLAGWVNDHLLGGGGGVPTLGGGPGHGFMAGAHAAPWSIDLPAIAVDVGGYLWGKTKDLSGWIKENGPDLLRAGVNAATTIAQVAVDVGGFIWDEGSDIAGRLVEFVKSAFQGGGLHRTGSGGGALFSGLGLGNTAPLIEFDNFKVKINPPSEDQIVIDGPAIVGSIYSAINAAINFDQVPNAEAEGYRLQGQEAGHQAFRLLAEGLSGGKPGDDAETTSFITAWADGAVDQFFQDIHDAFVRKIRNVPGVGAMADFSQGIFNFLGLDNPPSGANPLQDITIALAGQVKDAIEGIPDLIGEIDIDWGALGDPFAGMGDWITGKWDAAMEAVKPNVPDWLELLAQGDFMGAVRALGGGGSGDTGNYSFSGEYEHNLIPGTGSPYGGLPADRAIPVAKVFDADTTAFDAKVAGMNAVADAFAKTTSTSTFDIDTGPAAIQFTNAETWGQVWEDALFTAAFDIDTSAAAVAYTTAYGWGDTFANAEFVASMGIDISGVYSAMDTAVAVVRDRLGQIADMLPHSPAKEGPLAFTPSFKYIADAARRDLAHLPSFLEGALTPGSGAGGGSGAGSRGGTTISMPVSMTFHGPIYGVDDLETAVEGTFQRKVAPQLIAALKAQDRAQGGR